MSLPSERKKDLFLRGQKLQRLTTTDPDRVQALVCRTVELAGNEEARADPEKHWGPIIRPDLITLAATATPGSRFGLVCDAGLGKTFTMRWLFDQFCDKENRHLFGVRVPFLLRLDKDPDLRLVTVP